MKRITAQVLVGIVLLFCFAGQSQAETVEIEIRNFNFYPPDPVIDVGDTVVWTNKMNYGHWVISGVDMRHDNKFFSYLLLKGTKFSYTFRTPGDFPYYCPIHSMQAMVSVVGAEPAAKGAPTEEGGEQGGEKKRRRRR
ncbi:MAG: plastocyanin/azurin family copper-binding protein [Thermodesulfobacteriota bacterium]